MKTISSAFLIGCAFLLAYPQPGEAQTAKFRYQASVYADDQGAGFSRPEGVACAAPGVVVVADTGNDRLVRFSYLDKTVSARVAIRIPELLAPSRVQLNSQGEILALDGRERRIVRLSPDGEFKEVIALKGAPPPAAIVVKSFTLDQADNLYVLDAGSGRVLIFGGDGKFLRALPPPDAIGFASDLAVDSGGGILLLDSIRRRLYRAGPEAAAFARLGEDLAEVLATIPTSITSTRGSILVAEGSGSIVTLRRDGSFLARQLTPGWEEGSLKQPSQLCINDKDMVFIADRDNSRIQVFELSR